MNTKLLLVDLDGTIREPASGKRFIETPLDQKIIEGADKALTWYQEKGWDIIGISNQGGVAAGHKSLEDAIAEQRYTLELFPQIDDIFICTDFKGNECWWIERNEPTYAIHFNKEGRGLNATFRKPNPGMLNVAIKMFGNEYDRSNYWYVGDREEDKLAAAAAGVNFCEAEVWLNRFRPGIHVMEHATPKIIGFLEGYTPTNRDENIPF